MIRRLRIALPGKGGDITNPVCVRLGVDEVRIAHIGSVFGVRQHLFLMSVCEARTEVSSDCPTVEAWLQ